MTHPYWKAFDFWLACTAAMLFWLGVNLFQLLPDGGETKTLQYLLFVILVFPVLEEIVFRGLIQESIQKLLENNHFNNLFVWRISYANLYTSLIFSALHLWSQPFIWAAAILLPSLIFGYFKDRYQSLQPSILLHIFYNFGFYMLI